MSDSPSSDPSGRPRADAGEPSPAPSASPPPGAADALTDTTPDEELVARARAGSTAAFDVLVTRYRGRVYAMSLNMTGHDADAWDVSQEVFLRAWRSLARFEIRSQFFTWLFRITHNVVIDRVRRRRIEPGTEFNDELGSVPAVGAATTPRPLPEPDRALEFSELGARIKAALEKLTPEHRAVILLKEVDGLSYQEIADSIGCSTGTVMSRLFYARKRLQSLLRDAYDERQDASGNP